MLCLVRHCQHAHVHVVQSIPDQMLKRTPLIKNTFQNSWVIVRSLNTIQVRS